MATRTSLGARGAALNTLITQLNSGYLRIYTGPRPATPAAYESGILLAEARFSTPAFHSLYYGVGNNVNTSNLALLDTAVLQSGLAGHCRLTNAAGVGLIDGDVGVSGAGTFVELGASLTLTVGDVFRIAAGYFGFVLNVNS